MNPSTTLRGASQTYFEVSQKSHGNVTAGSQDQPEAMTAKKLKQATQRTINPKMGVAFAQNETKYKQIHDYG